METNSTSKESSANYPLHASLFHLFREKTAQALYHGDAVIAKLLKLRDN